MLALLYLLCLTARPALVSTMDLQRNLHPCNFDPRCFCSSGAADYGSVVCDGVPMADVPMELQESRVFQLRLRDNQMVRFPDAKLSGSGMWGLEVSHNPISVLPPMAFYGLERALWELHLPKNQLTGIPSDSISILKKLSVLDLADNHISELHRSDLRSVSSSLKRLSLAGNSLTSVPEGIFWGMQRLEVLDLSRNNIIQIHSMAFQKGVPLLSHIDLSGNLMGAIPFVSLVHVRKSLRNLDLGSNRIENIPDPYFTTGRLNLHSLDLSDNSLKSLKSGAFQNFARINHTNLGGNPIDDIKPGAFNDVHIVSLDLSHCFLRDLDPGALRGLERTLEELDLSANRLPRLPEELLADFDSLRRLRLGWNMIDGLSPNVSFVSFRFSIKDLELNGDEMRHVPMEEIGTMRNLRTLALPTVKNYGSLTPAQFDNFAPSLEELSLVGSGVKYLERHAFRHVPSVSSMDLSNNRIEFMDDSSFKDVGNALRNLRMSNALYFRSLPNNAFQSLTGIKVLDLSDNHITDIPIDTFHKMTGLEELYLQDNELSRFQRGTFHSQANPHLRVLDLSFNHLTSIDHDAFRFPELIRLIISDNHLEHLEPRAFVDMTRLTLLSLEGNQIRNLQDETFQNLHRLRYLNLAHNSLSSLNFAAFDSVGTLSHLSLDLSHNHLQALKVNRSTPLPTSIMSLHLSHNNISSIDVTFFEPVRNELRILNLSNNILSEVSPDDLGQLRRLHVLDLTKNRLERIEPTTFMASRRLRAVYLGHNKLRGLSHSIFGGQTRLKDVDLSKNYLESLPEQLFQRTSLENLRASDNKLTEIPVKALNPVQSTLRHLDLSGNLITTISDSQLNQIQLLVKLDLSRNQVTSVDREAFCCVPNLEVLNLGSNPLQRFDPDSLLGVRPHLRHLSLSGTNLTLLPSLQLPGLRSLDVSNNELTFVPPNTLANLSEVRELDLSGNHLPAPPSSAWHSMHHLRLLRLAGNPFTRVLNESFVGLQHLEDLDISDIDVESYQSGSFGTMPNLRRLALRLGAGGADGTDDAAVADLPLWRLLDANAALSVLRLQISLDLVQKKEVTSVAHSGAAAGGAGGADGGAGGVLRHTLQGNLPIRLAEITLEGEEIANVHPAAFKHLRSRRLLLRLSAVNRLSLDRDLFLNLGRVQNLSVEVINASASASSDGDRRLGSPVTAFTPDKPRAVFLDGLVVGGNLWDCDCQGIGWTERWFRRWRGVFCGRGAPLSAHATSAGGGHCVRAARDLRMATCKKDYGGGSVLKALKEDLECDSFNEANRFANSFLVVLALTVGASAGI